MALTEAKGSLEEQARAARFSAQLFEEKERQAAELAAMTSEQRVFEDEDGNAWDYVVIAERVVRLGARALGKELRLAQDGVERMRPYASPESLEHERM